MFNNLILMKLGKLKSHKSAKRTLRVYIQLKREERWPHCNDGPSKITGLNAYYTLMYGCGKRLDCKLRNYTVMWDKNASINNGNRTEWSPIQSVIIRVINKIGRPQGGSPSC